MCSSDLAYPGTHYNDTFCGLLGKIPARQKKAVSDFLNKRSGGKIPVKAINSWLMIEKLLFSRAGLTIFPVQDILELNSPARLNTPGTCSSENWSWRLGGRLPKKPAEKLLRLTRQAGRTL